MAPPKTYQAQNNVVNGVAVSPVLWGCPRGLRSSRKKLWNAVAAIAVTAEVLFFRKRLVAAFGNAFTYCGSDETPAVASAATQDEEIPSELEGLSIGQKKAASGSKA